MIWVRHTSKRAGVKLLAPEKDKDLWLGSPKVHVKTDWGKVGFDQKRNNIWVRHMSNQIVVKLRLADETKDFRLGGPNTHVKPNRSKVVLGQVGQNVV